MDMIWSRPDGGVSITHITAEEIEVVREAALSLLRGNPATEAGGGIPWTTEDELIDAVLVGEANKLQESGAVPADWELKCFRAVLPADRDFRYAWAWITPDPVVDICPKRAKEFTQARLRYERAPLLADLDVQYMRALERGDFAGMDRIRAEKQRLRDLPQQVDAVPDGDLDGLRALKV